TSIGTRRIGDLVYSRSQPSQPGNSHLHFRNSNRRRNSSLSPTGPSHLERAVCALASDDLPVQHYKGKYYRNVPVRCEKREEYSRPANRSQVQLELIPLWFATSHHRSL